jgi:two-component system LytT family response regulator
MEPGTALAQYNIQSLLGAGGMGEVYLAEDTRLGRKVAIKVLLPELSSDRERMERFLQEARVAAQINHPNVAHIYDIGEHEGAWYIAMEFIAGQPLSARLTGGSLPVEDIVSVGTQMADALEAAHELGVAHRDIKPANIMLASRGHVKLLDFGLAKVARSMIQGETQLLTKVGVVAGTVHYMSPEQALGRAIDRRSDIFSLGAVLYEMATGRPPFGGESPSEVIARLLREQPEAIARFNYELPADLERIIRKCLEKDAGRRYQSARELRVDLEGVMREAAPAAEAPVGGRLRVAIVDDEELARAIIREHLLRESGIDIVAECSNGFEAVKSIIDTKPDLVFLDVQMPKLDGFEVLELVGREVAVVFVTAYDQYAMKAFDAHAVDYLLKPFSLARFQTALERARQRVREAGREKLPDPVEIAAAARPPEQFANRIVVRDGAKVHIIPMDKLDYVEAQDDYVALYSQKRSYLKQQTISSLEASLDPARFVRIHRSWIVNIERVTKIEPYTRDAKVAILSDGTRLPVSRAGLARLRSLLGDGV